MTRRSLLVLLSLLALFFAAALLLTPMDARAQDKRPIDASSIFAIFR